MKTADHRQARKEGERRKDAAHALLEAHRDVLIRRARRALLSQLLFTGAATADDVADLIGPIPDGIDPRFLGTVPGPLAFARIIRASHHVKSCRPSRHASLLTAWELADRPAALAWLAHNPDMPDPEPDDGAETPGPASPTPPAPAPLATALVQPSLF